MKIDTHQKNRLKEFLVKKMKEEAEGRVLIEAPYRLNESDVAHFKKAYPELQGKEIETSISPGLLGGYVIRSGSTVIDSSVSSEITSLVSKLSH